MKSPEHVRISTAAGMTLGLKPGLFHRGAKLHCLNLLLTYEDGCNANCAYCGLARSRQNDSTFIRVGWPVYSLEEILDIPDSIERVCVSMVTHPDAAKDTISVIERVNVTGIPVSVLITPTLLKKENLYSIKEAGAERVGVAIDAATEELFVSLRGKGVDGPHKWNHYWNTLADAVDVFGDRMAGVHLIVGLGETEREMVSCIQRAEDMGAPTHLFSFFPEKGTKEENRGQPPIDVYRRIQLARYLINHKQSSLSKMYFDEEGRIEDLGVGNEVITKLISDALPFLTSGCGGCNRPYGNERPSQAIRNFPFAPDENDIADIRNQLNI